MRDHRTAPMNCAGSRMRCAPTAGELGRQTCQGKGEGNQTGLIDPVPLF